MNYLVKTRKHFIFIYYISYTYFYYNYLIIHNTYKCFNHFHCFFILIHFRNLKIFINKHYQKTWLLDI